MKVHCGEIICRDSNVRSGQMSRNKWCKQYNIPTGTFDGWNKKNLEKEGQRDHSGKPQTLDAMAKMDARAEVRRMQSSSDGSLSLPPKRKALEQLIIKYATDTILRTGKVLEHGEKITVCNTVVRELRDELFLKRKAKDMSDARFKALHNCQHGYQSAVMFAVLLSHLDEAQKFNTDCTTIQCITGENGNVRK